MDNTTYIYILYCMYVCMYVFIFLLKLRLAVALWRLTRSGASGVGRVQKKSTVKWSSSPASSSEAVMTWSLMAWSVMDSLSSRDVGKCSLRGVGLVLTSGSCSAVGLWSPSAWLWASLFFLKNSLSGGEPLVPAPLQTLDNTWLVMMCCSPSRFQ